MAVTVVAIAANSDDGDTGRDSIRGRTDLKLKTPLGMFRAHLDADGESTAADGVPARGHWVADIRPSGSFADLGTVRIGGPIICLDAVGRGANWRGIITSTTQPGLAPPGFGLLARWVDNGHGGNGPLDEQVSFVTPPPGPNPTCPPRSFTTGGLVLEGDLVVHDGV